MKPNRVNSTNSGTGKHTHGQFWDHRHVQCHTVAFLHTTLGQDVTNTAHFTCQFCIGYAPVVRAIFLVSFPQYSNLFKKYYDKQNYKTLSIQYLITTRSQMLINTIVACIQCPFGKPIDITLSKTTALNTLKIREPTQMILS